MDFSLEIIQKQGMVVFPSGARVQDTSGYLTGNNTDGRRIAIFADEQDAKAKKKILQHVIREWLQGVKKRTNS